MLDEAEHGAAIDAWLARSGALEPVQLCDLFVVGFRAIWGRASPTLGEVTLGAILARVLQDAGEEFPGFALLEVGPDGAIQVHALRSLAATVRPAELRAGLRFVLVELLTVVGSLTAEILTPELHTALSSVSPDKGAPSGTIASSAGAPHGRSKNEGRS